MPEKQKRLPLSYLTENLLTTEQLIETGYSYSSVMPASLFPGAWWSPARTRFNTNEAGPVLELVAGLEMQMFTSTSDFEDRRQSEYSRLWENQY